MLLKANMMLLLTVLSFTINAQEQYSNRWKEVRRTDREKKPVVYTDTFFVNSVTKTSLKMRKGSYEYNGTISNDLLEVGDDTYQMIRQDDTSLTIGDEGYIHIFERVPVERSAGDAAASIKENALPEKPVRFIDVKLLTGRWEAYKRSRKNNQPGKIRYDHLITSISFQDAGAVGVITTNGAGSLQLKELKDAAIIAVDDAATKHQIIVWKLTKDELIVEDEDGIFYYMKQF